MTKGLMATSVFPVSGAPLAISPMRNSEANDQKNDDVDFGGMRRPPAGVQQCQNSD